MFVGIEGLTPAFHDELVAPDGVRARRRALARRRSRCVPARGRRCCGADAEARARRATRTSGGKARCARLSARPPLRRPSSRVHVGAPRSSCRRSRFTATTDATQAPRRGRRRCACCGRSSITRARSATPSTSRRCSPRSKQWSSDGLRVAIACDSQSRIDRLHGVLAARGVDVRIATAGERPTRVPGVTLVPGAPAHGVRVDARRRRARHRRPTSSASASHHAERKQEAREGRAARRRRRLRAARAPATTSSTRSTASAATTASRSSRSAPSRSCRRRRSARRRRSRSRSTRSSSSTTAARCTCRSTGSARSSATSAPRVTRRSSTSSAASPGKRRAARSARHVRALAEELLQLYAQRAALPGHGSRPPTTRIRELEATFPFDETPDQHAAIDAVLGDMEAPRAMDRLVCGDVGYGKTEVALRAIFRARAGRQAGGAARADDRARRAALPHDDRALRRLRASRSASCRGSRARPSRSRP